MWRWIDFWLNEKNVFGTFCDGSGQSYSQRIGMDDVNE